MHFSRDDFVEILSTYDSGEFHQAQMLTRGGVQSSYLLTTSDTRVVFKYYQTRTVPYVNFEANLIEYIRRRDFPCPAVLRNKEGILTGEFKGKPFLIYEHIEGEHLQSLDEDQRRSVIKAAADLQHVTRYYRPAFRKARWHYIPKTIRKLAQDAAERSTQPFAQEKLAWIESQLNELSFSSRVPKGVCHSDYDLSNLLFKNGRFIALLDFDDANYTFLSFDLINLIDNWAWSLTDGFDPEFAREIVETYRIVRELKTDEKMRLFDVHKLQILVDSLWFFDRWEGDDFYEREKINYLNDFGRDAYHETLLRPEKIIVSG